MLKWVDSLAIPADAVRAENAHRFMNFYLRPEVWARVAEAIQTDAGNADALEQGIASGERSVLPDDIVGAYA